MAHLANPRPTASRLRRLRTSLRSFWATQVHLNELHTRRHDLSGMQALAALRAAEQQSLRWRGDRLVGGVLPEPPY